MTTIAILILLGIVLVVVLKAMFKPQGGAPAPSAPAQGTPPAAQPLELDPWDALKGDVVSISGGAEDYSDLDFPIDRRSAYEARNHRWVDLSGEFRGQRVYLEVYRFPTQDLIGILDPRKLTLAGVGLSEQQLADFDSRQDPSAYIDFEGKRWHWESSREIGYFENETGQGEGLYRWLFHEDNGARLLCIEKWEGEPFDVRLARRLNPKDITVYRAAA